MKTAAAGLAIIAALVATAGDAQRRGRPTPPQLRVGTCVRTTIAEVTQRLVDGELGRVIPDSGSAVRFANGLGQVSYDQVAPLNQSRRGDPVFVCLVALPENCPPGDHRGKLYTTTNLRTYESWTLPDSAHGCGGA
ncbi:hypothetical protein [Sphingosinicella sp.]|uniref:hypothetical protein n=1 Tax=Sphingosinicella sp. TaxID=1917971 RepID=UPI00403776CD